MAWQQYTESLTAYHRLKTLPVRIGDLWLGAGNPIRVQTMTTTDTMDTLATVEQSIRCIEAGAELVRITAPSKKEAENLLNIKNELRRRGYTTPLVADIHFTPNAAEIAARIVEKVRVNPGNYVDKKKFEQIEYTDAEYAEEIDRIRERFTPLVRICKEQGTAMRIGTNHGSLSDRIMSRYGDTAIGMVESAMEFLRIARYEDFHNIVLSMKSSNPQVMVQAYRLLVRNMQEEFGACYPLHLGVTEAGDGEDGRIKSAIGIGTLLEDGIGDTIRVSLTEDPEFEAPVARALIDRYTSRSTHAPIVPLVSYPIEPFEYTKRQVAEVFNFGGQNVPRVITDISKIESIQDREMKAVGHFYLPELDKWKMNDLGCDFIYSGTNPIPFMLPNGMKEIQDFPVWVQAKDKVNTFPLFRLEEYTKAAELHQELNFLSVEDLLIEKVIPVVAPRKDTVLILSTSNSHSMPALRRAFVQLINSNCKVPVVVKVSYPDQTADDTMLYTATDVGGLLVDGLGDGIFISLEKEGEHSRTELLDQIKLHNSVSFGVLQAARTRMSKTEYISCPSCGRTLFDLQETTAMIRKRTDHLKGVKIGIMGCIVNGPGEMADADYGYVGSGKGKITLYKGKEVVKRSVPSEQAVDELINIIREDGRWLEPEAIQV